MSAGTSRAPLSRGRVLAAAVDLADREGLEAVTMRRLASVLGVEAMSLYHHLPGKNALLDGLVDAVLLEVSEATPPSPTPMSGVRRSGNDAWAPAWSCSTIRGRPSPHRLTHHNPAQRLRPLRGHLGRDGRGRLVLPPRTSRDPRPREHGARFVQELFSPAVSGGSTDVDLAEEDLAAMADVLPHMTAMVASEIHDNDGDMLGWCDGQAEFEFTLDLLLDGLARQAG